MTAKPFHIGDVLSITTGRLISPRHIEGIYDILNHMTGDNLYTHQLGRAMEVCRPYLLSDHPWLKEMGQELISSLDAGGDNLQPIINDKLLEFIRKVGCSDINVLPLLPEQWLQIDPLKELAAMVGEDKILAINVDTEAI